MDFSAFLDKDAMLIVLIISGICTFAALVNLLSLITVCRRDEEKWKCGALMLTLFSFSAGKYDNITAKYIYRVSGKKSIAFNEFFVRFLLIIQLKVVFFPETLYILG